MFTKRSYRQRDVNCKTNHIDRNTDHDNVNIANAMEPTDRYSTKIISALHCIAWPYIPSYEPGGRGAVEEANGSTTAPTTASCCAA